MQLIKVVLAAVVGAGLGIGLMIALEAYARLEYAWIVVVVGLLAGLAMRWIASTGRASYLRGALAALLTLVVFIAGKYSVATVIANQRDAQVAPPPSVGGDDDGQVEQAGEAAAAAPAPLDLPIRDASEVLPTNPSNLDVNPLDAIWLVVGALVAYQLGKGRSAARAADSTATDDTQDDQPLVRGDDPSN